MLKLITKVKISKPDGSEVYKDFPTDRLDFKRNVNTKDDDDEDLDDTDKILS
jgi:hypothetical protein